MMEEFTWEQCLNLLDECVRCGIQTVTLTGGEPMLHPRFMDIVRECEKRRLNIAEINTNGSFITEEMLDEFHALGMDVLIKISYDGIGHHDWLRTGPARRKRPSAPSGSARKRASACGCRPTSTGATWM